MEIVNRVARMSSISTKLLASEVKLGLVSTMGGVHAGHVSLIQSARKMADIVLVAVFVNRLQFLSEDEFLRYPRDIMKDIDLLRQENVDYVFTPHEEEMYPPDFSTYVQVEELGADIAAPQARMVARGVATGMLKMIHLTRPAFFFLGQKDAVHGLILKKMMRDLNLSTEVVLAPVVRDPSGLAHAVRNRLLNAEQKLAATAIYRSLQAGVRLITGGETQAKKISAEIGRVIDSEPLATLEYVLVLNPETMAPLYKIQGPVMIGIGVRIGDIPLNDSLTVEYLTKS